MADHSKIAASTPEGLLKIILNALVGSTSKKVVSGVVLAIIAYLIHMKNKHSATENLRIKEDKNKKSVCYS